MGFCRDGSTTYLQRFGYNVVRLPRLGIDPLGLIGQQGGTVRLLGGLERLITGGSAALPAVTADQPSAEISGQRTDRLAAAIGLPVLDTLLGAFGATMGASAHYERAQQIQFTFREVTTDSVEPLAVGAYLRDGEVDVGNPLLEQYVLGNGALFVITAIVKSPSFSVVAMRRNGATVEVDVPALTAAVGANVEVAVEGSSEHGVTYTGDTPLVFGFQSFRVGVSNGDISIISDGPGEVALAAGAQDAGAPMEPTLLVRNELLELEEA